MGPKDVDLSQHARVLLFSPYMGGSCAGLRAAGCRDPNPCCNIPFGPCLTGEKSVQLVMEYVPLGSLRDYLPRHSVGLAQLLLFAQQICEVGRQRASS